jgi:hypothetical protein
MFDDYQTESAPGWLGGANGQLWLRVLGIMKDAFVAGMIGAVKQRFPSTAQPSSLVDLLEDRNLEPAWGEDATSVRARARAAWSTWEQAGTVAGLEAALRLAGYTNFAIVESTTDGTLGWWEFDVLLFTPFPWRDTSTSDTRWNDGGLWDDGGSWGAAMPEQEIARLRSLVRKWSGHPKGHARCRRIAVDYGREQPWDDDAPPGTWDDVAGVWIDDVTHISP